MTNFVAVVGGKQYTVAARSEADAVRQIVLTHKVDPRKFEYIQEEKRGNKALLRQLITYSSPGWSVVYYASEND